MTTDNFLDTFRNWANSDSRVSSVLLVNSSAIGEIVPKNSEIEIIILSTKVNDLLINRSWISKLGIVKNVKIEKHGFLDTILVYYVGGPAIKFAIYPYNAESNVESDIPADPLTRDLIKNSKAVVSNNQMQLTSHLLRCLVGYSLGSSKS